MAYGTPTRPMTCTALRRRWRVRPPYPNPSSQESLPVLHPIDTRDSVGLPWGTALTQDTHARPPLLCPEGWGWERGTQGACRSGPSRPTLERASWPQAPADCPTLSPASQDSHQSDQTIAVPRFTASSKPSPAWSLAQRTPQATPGWIHQKYTSQESWLPATLCQLPCCQWVGSGGPQGSGKESAGFGW